MMAPGTAGGDARPVRHPGPVRSRLLRPRPGPAIAFLPEGQLVQGKVVELMPGTDEARFRIEDADGYVRDLFLPTWRCCSVSCPSVAQTGRAGTGFAGKPAPAVMVAQQVAASSNRVAGGLAPELTTLPADNGSSRGRPPSPPDLQPTPTPPPQPPPKPEAFLATSEVVAFLFLLAAAICLVVTGTSGMTP